MAHPLAANCNVTLERELRERETVTRAILFSLMVPIFLLFGVLMICQTLRSFQQQQFAIDFFNGRWLCFCASNSAPSIFCCFVELNLGRDVGFNSHISNWKYKRSRLWFRLFIALNITMMRIFEFRDDSAANRLFLVQCHSKNIEAQKLICHDFYVTVCYKSANINLCQKLNHHDKWI